MSESGIRKFLEEHTGSDPISFHMPGHKGAELYREYGYGDFMNRMLDCDITEIAGADNLFQSEGIIRETSEKYRELYGVKRSYLLVNGTSGGLIAAILASVRRGGKLIMARNCHKSVFNALSLGDITPVYAYPETEGEYGIAAEVSPGEISRLIEEHPDADAIVLPSPNYYGICSDISAIARIAHSSGKILIVDQAHGAHLRFMGGGSLSAELNGADIIVNSTHKTLASLTQSALLNVNSDRVKLDVLEDKLQQLESSSPSYLLMASLDINADILREHGEELFSRWQDNLEYFYREAEHIKGLRTMREAGKMDLTKLNLDMSARGVDGAALESRLIAENIFPELTSGNLLMCMTGIGTTRRHMERLIDALRGIEIDTEMTGRGERDISGTQAFCRNKKRHIHRPDGGRAWLPIDDCRGRVCAGSIIPYPPGIPLLCPGEEIDAEDIDFIHTLRGQGKKVIGINENDEMLVKADPIN